MPNLLRKARRKLGTRSTRRRSTNGKGIAGTGMSGKKRTMCYRYPRPAKKLGWRVRAILGQLKELHPT